MTRERKVHGNAIDDGWWYRATDEQRIAQIMGGIECDMTGAQIAAVSDARWGRTVLDFAKLHGISFGTRKGVASRVRRARIQSARAAYDRGEEVNFWSDDPRVHRDRPETEVAEMSFE